MKDTIEKIVETILNTIDKVLAKRFPELIYARRHCASCDGYNCLPYER